VHGKLAGKALDGSARESHHLPNNELFQALRRELVKIECAPTARAIA